MDKRFLFLPILSVGLLLPALSNAGVVEKQMEMMVTVASSCELGVASMDFGNYAGTEMNMSGEVTVNCNDGVPYRIAMDAGLNSDTANRFLANDAGNQLAYRLTYQGVDWGDLGVHDTFLNNPVQGTGRGSVSTFTIEAMVFGQQEAPPGVYKDTVLVSIDF